MDDSESVGIDDLAVRLLDASLDAVAAWGGALPAPLGEAFRALVAGWAQGRDLRARAREHFVGPLGSPAFVLLAAVAEGLGGALPPRAPADAGEAMLCAYLAARCQDDRVDEGARPALAFLEHALLARAARLLAAAAGDAETVLAAWEADASDFAAAALDDDARRRDPDERWDAAAVARQGRKYLPMAGPLAALLVAAGRADALGGLRDAVAALGVGLQLTNDLLGAAHDLAGGARTPWLARLALAPGRDPPSALLPAVRRATREGALTAYATAVETALREGAARFAWLPGARVARHVEARVEALDRLALGLALRTLVGVPAVVVDVEVTRRCNLRCPACFVFAQEEKGAALPELPTPLLLEVLDELAGYRTHLHLTGGEPFLHRGLWDVLARAAERGVEDVVINTNGTLLDDAALARLGALRVPVKLLVSVDGPGDVQETARGAGTTAAALGVLRRAGAHGVAAVPATILTRELVAAGVGAWFDGLREAVPGLRAMVLWPMFLKPGVVLPDGGGGTALDAAALVEAARQVAPLMLAGWDVVVADYPVINPLLRRHGVPAERLWQCDAGRGRLSLQADGTVTPCHPFRLEVGRVAAGRVAGFVARALAQPDYAALGRRAHEGCATCDERGVCGSCQAAVVGRGGALFSNDGFCATVLGPRGAVDAADTAPPRRRLAVVR